MTGVAERINHYLTPARRQAIYKLIAVAGVLITAVSPALSTPVAQWTSVLMAAGTVGSLLLASVVTRAPQWPAIYTGMAALVTALVGASVLSDSLGDTTLRILQAVVTVAPLLVILARTDVRTFDGSPQAEVILTDVASTAPVVQPVTPTFVSVIDGATTTHYSDGTQATVSDAPPTSALS